MAERKWTDEQLLAIEERKKTLLVSAAAGSGKTATLTERIIRSLTDEDDPINIESLLCVTFTVAAAGELKVKLTRALEEAVEKNPTNQRLRHQLNMLPSAKIRTIDSFCNDILRMGADRVGLSPSYRIADGAECELLAVSILDGLISAIYRGELPEVATPDEFEALADCLTDSKRTEELSDVMRLVYSKLDSSELSVDAMLPLIEKYDTSSFVGVENTAHGEYLFHIIREFATHYKDAALRYEMELSRGDDGERLYAEMAAADVKALDALLCEDKYSDLRAAVLSFTLVTKPRMKKGQEKSDTMLSYSDLRDELREDFRERIAPFFSYSESEWRDSLDKLHDLLLVLYKFQKKFDQLFLDEKKRRAALSYADVERLAYQCLIKDGKRTDIAENLAGQFEAIYIDEYQDVNSLQNSIFEAISGPTNRFMVGDIKQSIYGFRSARPEIFAELKSSYPQISQSTGDTASIFMSRNFRCDRGIVDFVNGIFDKTFSLVGESIGYEDGDRLRFSKVYEGSEPPYKRPTVCVVDKQSSDSDEDDLGEPEAVAAKISELLAKGTLNSGKPVRPSDIAIIIRSARNKDVLYAEALKRAGIPAQISGAKSFFMSSEVLLVLCLLNSIDNPRRDIYLAGLMCSPIFAFDADDLYLIRHGGGGNTLYESLVSYTAEHPEFEKGIRFLRKLDYYRTIAEGVGVDTLLSKLYRECGLMALATRSGGADNLTVLYDYARSYEGGSYKGLYNFISFINSILDKKTSFDDKREGGEQDAVKIITCHSSKGLEYPIVFLAGARSAFSSQDVRQRLVYSDDMGFSFRLRTPSGLAVVDSPIHDLTCHYILRKQQEEELRVLYVALTRAREQLYVVGTSGSVHREVYESKINLMRDNLSPYVIRCQKNYLDLILSTSDGGFVYPENFISGYTPPSGGEKTEESEPEDGEEFILEKTVVSTHRPMADEFARRFSFEYPHRYMTILPEKLSVSRTSPHVLEEDTGILLFADEGGGSEATTFSGAAFGQDTANNSDGADFDLAKVSKSDHNLITDGKTQHGYDDFSTTVTNAPLDLVAADPSCGNISDEESSIKAEGDEKRHLPAFVTGGAAEESAKRGISTHQFLQFCDLELLVEGGAEAELKRLISQGFLSEKDGERVRISEIKSFVKSQLLSDMRSAKALYRELRFNVRLPAGIFTTDPEQRAAYVNRDLLVQGVIDCIVEYPDGSLGLYDYKTDRLTAAERKAPELAYEKLRSKHTLQLSYYALAIEKMFGKKPARVGVYSLPLGKIVPIDVMEF